MGFQRDRQELRAVLATLWKRLGLTVSLGILVGSACAVFLAALDWVTAFREARPAVIFGLPLAGMAVGLMYSRFGRGIEGGNNLIIEEIHEPGGGIPWRMAPLILLGTLVTHLFGGSAGREGTAVQMGGGIAGGLARLSPGLSRDDLRILLMAGVSAGFGGVFGTPVAGTIFAMEVLIVGRMNSAALMPCLQVRPLAARLS